MERKEQTAQGANYWSQRMDALLAGDPQSGGRAAGTLGGRASASKMPSDLVTQPCLFPDASS